MFMDWQCRACAFDSGVHGDWIVLHRPRREPLDGSKGQGTDHQVWHSKYVKYHGSDEGWAQLLELTKTATEPPAGFDIAKYVPPTPVAAGADIVLKKQAQGHGFCQMGTGSLRGKQEDKDKVWNAIKGQPLQMVGSVITATPTKLQIAAKRG